MKPEFPAHISSSACPALRKLRPMYVPSGAAMSGLMTPPVGLPLASVFGTKTGYDAPNVGGTVL